MTSTAIRKNHDFTNRGHRFVYFTLVQQNQECGEILLPYSRRLFVPYNEVFSEAFDRSGFPLEFTDDASAIHLAHFTFDPEKIGDLVLSVSSISCIDNTRCMLISAKQDRDESNEFNHVRMVKEKRTS